MSILGTEFEGRGNLGDSKAATPELLMEVVTQGRVGADEAEVAQRWVGNDGTRCNGGWEPEEQRGRLGEKWWR